MSCDPQVFPIQFLEPGPRTDSGPFLAGTPDCRVESLDELYSFAFSYARPNGILLFPTSAAAYVRHVFDGVKGVAPPAHSLKASEQLSVERFFSPSQTANPQTQDYWVHVTDSCNLGCFYCYIPEVEKFRAASSSSMTLEIADLILRRAFLDAESRGIRRIHFKFAGGEPSLALNSIQDFCLSADRIFDPTIYKVTFGMITNGVAITKDLLEFIVARNFTVSFSIDGVEKYHDRSRHLGPSLSNEGTWKGIVGNARILHAAGIKPFFLHTLTTTNIDGLQDLQSFLVENDWNFRVSMMRLSKRPSLAQRDRFRDVLEEVFENAAMTLPLGIRFEQHLQFAEWNIRRKKNLACGSGRNYLAVDHRGGVSSCQMADVPVADLALSTIADARDSIRLSEATKYLADPELRSGGCTKCFYRHTCAGGCPQHTAHVYSTMNHVSPWCEVYGQLYPGYVRAAAKHQYRRLKFMLSHAQHRKS